MSPWMRQTVTSRARWVYACLEEPVTRDTTYLTLMTCRYISSSRSNLDPLYRRGSTCNFDNGLESPFCTGHPFHRLFQFSKRLLKSSVFKMLCWPHTTQNENALARGGLTLPQWSYAHFFRRQGLPVFIERDSQRKGQAWTPHVACPQAKSSCLG